MSVLYRTVKSTWRTVAPPGIHDFFFDGRGMVSKAVLSIKSKLENRASHDDIYDAAYYANYTEEMERSAVGMADTIADAFEPSSVIDIGCGSGEVLQQFSRRGIDAKGADLSSASLEVCRSKGLTVQRLDLENLADVLPWKADVVISTEVAEHLPASLADHYVRTLISLATNAIVITGAPPGQGGTDHVNEQPYSYWIAKFVQSGATYSDGLTEQFRTEWAKRGVEASRARNVMVFLVMPPSLAT